MGSSPGRSALTGGIGALLFGCAYMLMTDPAIRRLVVLLMVISSIVLLLSSAFGFLRVDDAVTDSPLMLGATGTEFTATVAIGLAIPGLGERDPRHGGVDPPRHPPGSGQEADAAPATDAAWISRPRGRSRPG